MANSQKAYAARHYSQPPARIEQERTLSACSYTNYQWDKRKAYHCCEHIRDGHTVMGLCISLYNSHNSVL